MLSHNSSHCYRDCDEFHHTLDWQELCGIVSKMLCEDLWGVLKTSSGMHVGIVEEGAGEMKYLRRNVSLTCGQTKNRCQ